MRKRPCPGFEKFYVVRDDGSVIRSAPGVNARVGRALTPHVNRRTGYAQVTLHSSRQTVRRVAPLVCRAFHGPPKHGQEVNHKNGRKNDDRASNLEWVTRSENCRHRSRVLGKSRGELHGRAKLTEQDVREIRRRLARGDTKVSIADNFGITPQLVRKIQRHLVWTHV